MLAHNVATLPPSLCCFINQSISSPLVRACKPSCAPVGGVMEHQHDCNRRLSAAQRSTSFHACMTPAHLKCAPFPCLPGSIRRCLSAGPPSSGGPPGGGPLVDVPCGAHCPPAERQHGRRMRDRERSGRGHRAEAVGCGHLRHAPAAHGQHRAPPVRVWRGQRAERRVRQDDLCGQRCPLLKVGRGKAVDSP